MIFGVIWQTYRYISELASVNKVFFFVSNYYHCLI